MAIDTARKLAEMANFGQVDTYLPPPDVDGFDLTDLYHLLGLIRISSGGRVLDVVVTVEPWLTPVATVEPWLELDPSIELWLEVEASVDDRE